GVRAIDVLQHSHARLSICISGPRLPLAAIVVYISAMFPSSSLGMLRPSSQMATSLPSAVGVQERNPCWRFLPSRCGTMGFPHVAPASFEKARLMSYASELGPPVATSQFAAKVPSDITARDGKSAGLTNQFVPLAIVFGADQPCGPRIEKRRALPLGEAGSSQFK